MLHSRPPFPGADPQPGQQPMAGLDDSHNDMAAQQVPQPGDEMQMGADPN